MTIRHRSRGRWGTAQVAELVTYELADGTPVRFEIEPPDGFRQAGSGAKVLGKVSEAAGSVLRAAGEVLQQAKALGPDEIVLSFSLKVTGEAGWAIAKAGTEGSFEVALTWRPQQEGSHGVAELEEAEATSE